MNNGRIFSWSVNNGRGSIVGCNPEVHLNVFPFLLDNVADESLKASLKTDINEIAKCGVGGAGIRVSFDVSDGFADQIVPFTAFEAALPLVAVDDAGAALPAPPAAPDKEAADKDVAKKPRRRSRKGGSRKRR